MKEVICGIYEIVNKTNGKKYIGQSVNIKKRWNRHRTELNNNEHCNSHLQNAWNKYGEENFVFNILSECVENQLNELEQMYIKEHKSYDPIFGYNHTFGGDSGKRTPEAIENIRRSQTGKKLSNEHKDKISKGGIGLKRSEETKNKIRISKKGENLSDITIQKHIDIMLGANNPMFGKHHSENTRNKISEKISGENHPFFGKFGGDASHTCSVMCLETGEIFEAIVLAQQWCGLKSASGIISCLHGRQKSAGKHPVTGERLHWKYVEETTNHNEINDLAV